MVSLILADHEILWAIVGTITIEVMHDCLGRKRPSLAGILNDQEMFFDCPTRPSPRMLWH